MAKAYLSLGSNVDPERCLIAGIHSLREQFGDVICSSVFQCPAEGFDGDDFLNMAAIIHTDLSPQKLKEALHDIEYTHGRTRGAERFTDRTLDIDLVLYDDIILDEPGLQIPRDELDKYSFVLAPLAEIAPEYTHPVSGIKLQQLWQSFDRLNSKLTPISIDFNDKQTSTR
ncbi:MAG: 2-amino-4-hydroxy-6-hydroxymethyldihydropteridine diphosphokinase [bacterium]